MKNILRGRLILLAACVALNFTTFGATVTSDTLISFTNLDLEGADIVVTNCALTVEGNHTFGSLQLLSGSKLTQIQTDDGLRFVSTPISNESHVLTGTNLVTLNNTNVVTSSPIVITDPSGTVTYANGTDYVLITNFDGSVSTGRIPGSSIPDGGTVFISYTILSLLGATGVNLVVTGDVLVNSNAAVDVNGLGFGAGFGPGAGGTLGGTGGGGGHGGYGGLSATNAPGGIAFDSILTPTDKGCAGGNGASGPGGTGGGAIKLSIGGLLRVDGIITANGANGTNNHSGGGAGGSIWMSAAIITGSGSIKADGGDGEPTLGGGGGGGLIALYFNTNSFSGVVQARGGKGAVYGGAGTYYTKVASQSVGQLLADNGGHRGTNTLLVTTEPFDVGVQSGAVLFLTATQTVGSLVLASNGWVSCVDQWLNVLKDATIQTGGGIVANGTGYTNWVGVGLAVSINGYYTSGGGGYGGFGAASKEVPPGGPVPVGGTSYGSILQPTDKGSGGGNVHNPDYPSGTGGGAVLLTVGRTLTVEGQISADGGRGLGQGGGGGSGGSVWITTSNIIGSGIISASGGGADGLAGGGGGGRIAIYFQSSNFEGSIAAVGGVGGNTAAAGTIYTRDLHQPVGSVLVDNGNHFGTNTVISSQQAFDLVAQRGAVITPSGNWNLKSLTVSSNASVFGSTMPITITGDASVASGGAVIADGSGYASGAGPGSGRTGTAGGGGGGGGTLVGSGASHGGYGGAGGGAVAPGNVYDTVISPGLMGSGGGSVSTSLGGAGGGAISFNVTGKLLVDGRISADGAFSTNQNCGGGSGGSIFLNAGTLSGSGLVSANGGNGAGLGGGGGGGRISISYNTNAFAGSLRAFGGSGTPYGGGAGTIYLKNKAQSIGQIVIDNAGTIGAGTDIGSAGSPINLTLTGGGALWGPSTGPPLFQNLTIDSNSFYYPSNSSTITVLANATVRGGGGIVADGAGSPANSGNGPGRFGLAGSGGGYGGFGASGSNSVGGGITYGIAVQPSFAGSGGGGFSPNSGGAGGGVVRVNVTGTLALDGRISADGRPGTGLGGGGSGGSVWLSAGNFAGAGIVSANGGSGSATGAGGGGGGRIAITTLPGTNGFTGSISAFGGSGFSRGGAGSIYTRFGSQNVGQILVDNGGVTGTNTTVTDQNFDVTIRHGANLALTSSSFMHNLVINSNGWLTVANTPITVTGTATIQTGGGIVANGASVGSGQGAGRSATSGLRGGAGYGGFGAANPPSFPSGNSYGSLQNPTDTGSLGGSGTGTVPGLGGAGGGAIHLIVSQNLAVDGRISANGNPGGLNSGGGSGGSVWLEVGSILSGAGLISANGGSGDPNFGGGGGGGRISLSYANNLFTGAVSAFGGGGVATGGAGTIYFKGNNPNLGLIQIDNGGALGTNTGLGFVPPTGSDLIVKGGGMLAPSTISQLHNVTIASNSWLNFGNSAFPKTVTGDFIVQTGGSVSAEGAGYPGSQGSGFGGNTNVPGLGTTGGGGGHGGRGASSVLGARGGNSYDSVSAPSDSGSGGGYGSGDAMSGAGGGIIPLNVIGKLVVDGSMTANGTRSLATGGGGGAGGSIVLTVGALSGSGVVSANGGAGNGFGGGGGGGRIAIHYGTNSFAGLLAARGGLSTPAGGAGTVYVQATNQSAANVLVDNGGNLGTNTPLDFSQQVMLTVGNGAVAQAATGSLLLSNLVIGSGGKFTGVAGQTNCDIGILGNAMIQVGGAFSFDGLGYGQTNGPGAGTNFNGVGSGGGYGGNGGASSQSAGGTTYGSPSQPIDRGSGGGAGAGLSGSQGGGSLRLTIGGALTVDGQVTANGNAGFWDDAGGGSGGGIWIAADSVSGAGLISASGGAGELNNGGGGGGGRIAVYSRTNNFAGTYSVLGGAGFANGQDGSVYFSSNFLAPVVISQTPVGTVTNDAVNSVTLLFNTPVDPLSAVGSFQLLTPAGPVQQSNMVVSSVGSSGLRFTFLAQAFVGNYTITAGPQIKNMFGQTMSQVYTGSFVLSLPAIQGFVTDTNGQPVSGVVMQPNFTIAPAITTSNGEYAIGAFAGLTITPIKPGYMFVPYSRTYDTVSGSISNENYLAVTTIAPNLAALLQGTNIIIGWSGLSGVSYQLYFSTNLVDWQVSSAPIPGTNGPMQLPINIFSNDPMYFPLGFYRLRATN